MSGSTIAVGVDGGGTRTTLVAVDGTGNELARLDTSTSNAAVIGHDAAARTLAAGLTDLAGVCGSPLPFTAGWFGLSGSDRPDDHDRLLPALRRFVRAITMTNDAEMILGALPGRTGVALVSGTGSIAFGRDRAGRHDRAGGWGHRFSDEGSGYDLGVRALRAFAAEADGRGLTTAISPRLTAHFDLAEPHQLIARVYNPATTKADIAALATIVLDVARAGDPVAERIVDEAAAALASLAVATARRLDLADRTPLALTGGLLLHNDDYRDRVLGHIRRDLELERVELVRDPALAAARSLVGQQAAAR